MAEQCNIKVTYNNTDVKAHCAYYLYRNKDVALIYIDLSDRHCETSYSGSGMGSPCIGIGVVDKDDSIMEISFEDYDSGWSVFSYELCKYTIAVTLYKKSE